MSDPETFFLLNCLECDEASGRALEIPFGSPADRGKWAAAHTKGTGHQRWRVLDITDVSPTAKLS
jgi:hypothetical protein